MKIRMHESQKMSSLKHNSRVSISNMKVFDFRAYEVSFRKMSSKIGSSYQNFGLNLGGRLTQKFHTHFDSNGSFKVTPYRRNWGLVGICCVFLCVRICDICHHITGSHVKTSRRRKDSFEV